MSACSRARAKENGENYDEKGREEERNGSFILAGLRETAVTFFLESVRWQAGAFPPDRLTHRKACAGTKDGKEMRGICPALNRH